MNVNTNTSGTRNSFTLTYTVCITSKQNWMLASKLHTCKYAGHPECARAPKGAEIGTPFHQVLVLFKVNDPPDSNDGIDHESITTDCIEEADPPTNVTNIRLYPGTRRLCHGRMATPDEANTWDNLPE